MTVIVTTGGAAEVVVLMCLDAFVFTESGLWVDGQLVTCPGLSAITYLSYQNLAADIASDQ